jgi:hypothetical protein
LETTKVCRKQQGFAGNEKAIFGRELTKLIKKLATASRQEEES